MDRHWRIREWFPDLSEDVFLKFKQFHSELIYFNKRMNLISARTERNADQIHIADCIMGAELILNRTKAEEIYDLGSGNGCPGLIMALLAPERQFVLVDKDSKKVEFLKFCISRLNLKNVRVERCRLEDLPVSIECAVSRGLASLSKMVMLLEKICEGESYHFKSQNWAKEVPQMSIPIHSTSNWSFELIGEYQLPNKGPYLTIIACLPNKCELTVS